MIFSSLSRLSLATCTSVLTPPMRPVVDEGDFSQGSISLGDLAAVRFFYAIYVTCTQRHTF